ncbi:MAG: hypothetical protein ABSB97_07045 [Thermoplasmata archaeon]
MSPASWVQLLQALTARELVEGLGIPSRQAAEMLGLAPSAISQYLSGKRLSRQFARYASNEPASGVAREVAGRLTQTSPTGVETTRILLEGAVALADLAGPAPGRGSRRRASGSPGGGAAQTRALAKWIRQRVRVEQAAVTQCMNLAQKARDELTRAIFRQIASDSLRHAEIVASLAPYLDRGIAAAHASGVTVEEVGALIEGERQAEAQADTQMVRHLGGTMALLIASMEADERKHAELLRGLLESGFPERLPPRRRSGPKAPAPEA